MTTLLSGIVGSTAYGLATKASDVDMLACHLGSTKKVLGFGLSKSEQSRVTIKPDTTSHEIGKYVSLAARCNPTITELMWLPNHVTKTEIGKELVDLRYHFLSEKGVKSAYIGYAVAQAKRLLRRGDEGKSGFGDVPTNRTAKHGRHCFRLLTQAEQLLRYEHLTVRLDFRTAEHVFEMGEWAERDPQAFHDAMMQKAAALESIDSVLDDEPDLERIEKWLVSVRVREPYL